MEGAAHHRPRRTASLGGPQLRTPTQSRVGMIPSTLAIELTGEMQTRLKRVCAESVSRRPQRAEVHGRISRLPAAQEALDRRVQNDAVEIADREQPMPPHGGVL